MNDIWLRLIEQAPNTVVNLIIVYYFLGYIKHRDEAQSRILKDLGDSCHTFQKDVSTEFNLALNKNSAALERNTEALGWSNGKAQRVMT